jgi:WhiB family redox-sensing transcriptional regulator
MSIEPLSNDWRHAAACAEEDPELFFPVGTSGQAAVQLEEAKAVCRRCDVVAQCGGWALSTGQEFGVWGGLSEDERRRERRRNARRRAEVASVAAEVSAEVAA